MALIEEVEVPDDLINRLVHMGYRAAGVWDEHKWEAKSNKPDKFAFMRRVVSEAIAAGIRQARIANIVGKVDIDGFFGTG